MTWKELKEQVEAGGVGDDDEIACIDYDPDDTFCGMGIIKNSKGQWIICNEDY